MTATDKLNAIKAHLESLIDNNPTLLEEYIRQLGEVGTALNVLKGSTGSPDTDDTTEGTTATLNEIKEVVGGKGDETAHSLSGYYGSTPWSFVSLIRGIFGYLERMATGYTTFYVNQVVPLGTFSVSKTVRDYSGIIENANSSFIASAEVQRSWLLIQNFGKLNPDTGSYVGDLWINFGYDYNPVTNNNDPTATTGPGSYRLPPGATLSLEGGAMPFGKVALLGTIAGIEYTFKETGYY